MNATNSQTKRALSAALFILLLSVVGMKNALAQTQNYPVVILQHNDSIRAFYGANAFVEANAAASNGDTITLSGGNFNGGCTVNKAITIHGAGCVMDTVAALSPTVLENITITQINDTLSLIIEGVHINTITFGEGANKNMYISRCNVGSAIYNPYYSGNYHYGYVFNSHFVDCIIGSFSFKGSGCSYNNCVMNLTYYSQLDRYDPNTIINSVILLNWGVGIDRSMVMNSIIKTVDNNSHTNSSFFNCIGIKKGNTSLFEDMYYSTNMEVNDYVDVFKTFDGTVTYDNIYQLKEEIINTFPGNDGTQVGIYGGMKPYDTRLSYMIMKRCNVAGSTTIDNKLSVEIELKDNGE